MLELTREHPVVSYIMRSRHRTSSLPHPHPPDNLCRLFWESVIRGLGELTFVSLIGLLIVGTLFQVTSLLSGYGMIHEGETTGYLALLAFTGGVTLVFIFGMTIAVVVLMAFFLIKEVYTTLTEDIQTTRPKQVNVAVEYVKSVKERWCPMIRYTDDKDVIDEW